MTTGAIIGWTVAGMVWLFLAYIILFAPDEKEVK